MTVYILSLGSNMGDSRELLKSGLSHLESQAVFIDAVSQLYSTSPWGGVDQNDFLNITVHAHSDKTPYEVLETIHDVEATAQRTREVHWGPRTLDIDIIAAFELTPESHQSGAPGAGEIHIDDAPTLSVPHPFAHQRAFVLRPWLDFNPEAVLNGTLVVELLESLDESERSGIQVVGDL